MLDKIKVISELSEHGQSVAAKTATAVSGGGFITSVAAANEWVQIFAGIIAIVAGIVATWWHLERIYDAHQRRDRERDNDRARSDKKRDSS